MKSYPGWSVKHSKGEGSMFTKPATQNTKADMAKNSQSEISGHKCSLPAKGARNSRMS
jgi:hypothetical protein